MPSNFDNLSDGSELTGDELPGSSSESEERVKRTPSKKRKTIQVDDEEEEDEDEDQVVGEELEEEEDEEDDEFKDELEEEVLPSKTSRRGKVTSMPSKPSPLKITLRRSPTAAKRAKSKLAASSKSKDLAKLKWKANQDDDEEEEEEDEQDLLPSASASSPATPMEGEGDVLSGTDNEQEDELMEPGTSSPAVAKTARQLAKENKDSESTLLELPMTDESKKRKLTEAELALRRSETARKRRNQSEKKLEDDKIETINRLLKKQVGRSRTKLPRQGSVSDNEEDAAKKKRGAEILTRAALKERPAPFFRYVSSVNGSVLGVPTGPPLVAEVLPITVHHALIQEINVPEQVKAEKEEEEALEAEWGPEGLYEYRMRTQFAMSRKQWIGARKKQVTPPPEPEPQQKKQADEDEQQDEAEEEDDDEDQEEEEEEEDEEEE